MFCSRFYLSCTNGGGGGEGYIGDEPPSRQKSKSVAGGEGGTISWYRWASWYHHCRCIEFFCEPDVAADVCSDQDRKGPCTRSTLFVKLNVFIKQKRIRTMIMFNLAIVSLVFPYREVTFMCDYRLRVVIIIAITEILY